MSPRSGVGYKIPLKGRGLLDLLVASVGLSHLESNNQACNTQWHCCYFKHVMRLQVFPHRMAHLHVESLFLGLIRPPIYILRLKTFDNGNNNSIWRVSMSRFESAKPVRFRARSADKLNITHTFGKRTWHIISAVLT